MPVMTTDANGMRGVPHLFLSGRLVPVPGFGSLGEAHRLHSAAFPFLDTGRRLSPSNVDALLENSQQFSPAAPAHQDPTRPAPTQGCYLIVNSAGLIMPPTDRKMQAKTIEELRRCVTQFRGGQAALVMLSEAKHLA